jgi:hypothetical protein
LPNANTPHRFIIGLGVAIGFAAAVPKLGATGGYIRAEYSIKLPAIIIIFIISGLGLKTKALLTAAGDLRIHFLVQVRPGLRVGFGRDAAGRGCGGTTAVVSSCSASRQRGSTTAAGSSCSKY